MTRPPQPGPLAGPRVAILLALACSSCHLLVRPLGGGLHDFEGTGYAAWIHAEAFGLHLGGDLLDSDGEPLLSGERVHAVSSPGGGRILVLSARDGVRAGGWRNYPTTEAYLWTPAEGGFERLTSDRTLEQHPAIDPTGRFAGFFRATSYADTYLAWPWSDFDLVVVDLETGVEEVWALGAATPHGIALHPSGRFVAAAVDGALLVIDRERQVRVPSASDVGELLDVRDPTYSEDGSQLAFVQRDDLLCVADFDPRSGALGTIRDLERGVRPLAFRAERILCEREAGDCIEVVAVSPDGALAVLARVDAFAR